MHMNPSPAYCLLLKYLLPLWVFIASAITGTTALAAQHTPDANLKAIQSILAMPDKRIDLAKVKLTIDYMIDPSINIGSGLKQLNSMAKEIRAGLPANPSSRDKLDALRTYLYQAGSWNDNHPFHYDLDDPFGHNIHNKLLTTYLTTRTGNCVSMPILFILLGQKIGLDVTASTAPEHIFVKYRDDAGALYNLETTSGAGFTRDAWMRQQIPMSDQALSNGIYMQPLSKKETAVLIIDTLNEYYAQQTQEERRIALAKLELKHYPKFVTAMLHIASASRRLLQQNFVNKYPTPNDIPLQGRTRYTQLEQNVQQWRAKAEALGWQEPTQTDDASYLQTVNQAKTTQ
ncbi:transglutaminase family protein [Sulfuriferula thiophila]|uniref:transglutaminase family protein n=1 Tax=Sulfuriferula thiophila TaxID=1781211 RepID=UPI0016784FD5|nr:transglutaminase family protein [Sulfuriferula thiophila]